MWKGWVLRYQLIEGLRKVGKHKDLGIWEDQWHRFHFHVGNMVCKARCLANYLIRTTVCRDGDFMVQFSFFVLSQFWIFVP